MSSAGTVQIMALIGTVVLGLVLGAWSYIWPLAFFDHFPVVFGEWISRDGPFNEHLVRDHGAMYLALAAAGVYGLFDRSQGVCRALGIAWGAFGVLHFAYHVTHLGHLSQVEAVSQLIALALSVLLAVGLFVPTRRHVDSEHTPL